MSNVSDFVIKDGVLKKYSGIESEIIIPNGVTIIGFEAFKHCNSLKKVVIPDGVTKIRSNAFSECGGLTDVTIPKSVSVIGDLAFYDCKSLTNLTIDFGVKKIEPWAFCGCSSLTSISIPDSVTSIGENAFGDCNITKVTMSESVFELFWKSFDKNSGEMPDLAYCFMKDGVVYKRTSEYIRRNRAKLLDAIIKNDDAEAMAGYLSIFNKLTVGDIDEYLKKAEGATNVKTVLLDYEKKRFTGADKDSFYEDQTSKELGVKEHTLAEWKKIFKIDFSRSEGAYITGYKGNDTVVMIPAKVGNNPVYGIAFKAFENNDEITNVIIEDGITTMEDNAFFLCSKLESVTIPNSVERIGLGAFSYTAIYKNKANWDENVLYFDKCLLEANSDHLSGNYTIKDGTRLIADGAFSACKNLTGIIIPSSVISIGSRAFWGCRGLTDVMIPDGVERIGENAFYSCENITDVTIPKSATSIDSYAFHCCNLKTITVDPANPVYDSRNNCNAIIETKSNSLIIACSNTVIPEGVTSISDYAFSSCKALTSVSIPESVTTIGKCAFSNCSSLNGIIIPNSVKKIGKMAFSSTDSLKEMTIPMNCIGESLFGDKDLAIIMKVTRPGKETKRVVAVFRKQCPNKGREYKKSFIIPLEESAIHTYDALVANGSYDKFKMPADDRIRAAIWRLQDDEFPVTEDTKTAFANFLTSKLTKALQLAEEDAAPSYIETLCSDCNLEEKHISKIKKAVSASKIQDIKALENKLVSMI